jgi:hypothetical protein
VAVKVPPTSALEEPSKRSDPEVTIGTSLSTGPKPEKELDSVITLPETDVFTLLAEEVKL